MKESIRAVRGLLTNRFAVGGMIVGGLGVLHAIGALLPLIRFALSLGLVLAVVAAIIVAYRQLMPMLKPDTNPPQGTSSQLKVVAVASGATIVCCSLALLLLPTGVGSITSTEERSPSLPATISTTMDKSVSTGSQPNETDAAAAVAPKRSPNAISTGSQPNETDAGRAAPDQTAHDAADILGTLIQSQLEAERRAQNDPRYQQFQNSLQQLSLCPRCGGQGNYRYVDQWGVLQVQSCPSCLGSGKAY